MAFGRLKGRLDAVQADAHSTMGFIRDLLKDFIADVSDGVALKIMPLTGFSKFANKLLWSVVPFMTAYLMWKLPLLGGGERPEIDLTWMERQEIPIAVTADISYDVQPGPEGTMKLLMDGPLKGNSYRVRGGDQRRVHLEGGHWYIWDGHNMVHLEPETAENN